MRCRKAAGAPPGVLQCRPRRPSCYAAAGEPKASCCPEHTQLALCLPSQQNQRNGRGRGAEPGRKRGSQTKAEEREKKSSIGESYPGMGQTSFLLGPALRLRLVPCVGTCISCSREVDVGFRLPESASQQPKTPRMPVQLLEEVGRGRRPARWSITNAASVPQLRCFEIPQTWTEIRKANQPDTNLAAFCLLETCAIDVDPDATAVSLLALTPTAQASEKGKNGKKRIVNVVGGAARVRSFRFVS